MLFFLKCVYSLAQGNTVCGNMSGQHLYVPVDATAVVDPVRLFAFVGNSGAGYRSDTSKTLRNRIQARHSGTGYRSDTQGQRQVRHPGTGYRCDGQTFKCVATARV
jgi:hypothetical protein